MSVLAVLVALSLTPPVRPALALSPGQAQGQAWDAGFFLGGLEGGGHALATYDDGSGPALYVGGSFTAADDVPASRIVRWDGRRYEALGSGLAGTSSILAEVLCLAVFDDGTGPELYAGGRFTRAGNVNASGIAKWNGSRWAAVGAASPAGIEVHALAVFDDGSGPALYAGGRLPTLGGITANGIARWDGSAWAPVGGGFGSIHSVGPGEVEAMAVFQGRLYAGGTFAKADGLPARDLACWDGAKWRALGAGASQQFGSSASVFALETCRDERGEFLLIGGDFDMLDERPAPGIARFDGHDFVPIGAGLRGSVHSLAQHDDGRGKALYAGGVFFLPDGGPRVSIARWDGRTWALVGDDLSVENGTAPVVDLEVFDGGQGKTLFAVGGFGHSGTHAVRCLAELKQGEWRSLTGRGQGMVTSINSASQSPAVRAFELWDDGGGEALYAAGEFIAAGTAAALRIARFDGSEWVPVGDGPWALGGGSHVQALRAFDDGTGSSLFAGGDFTHLGSQAIPALARWDGVAWWPVGGGIGFSQPFGFRPEVRALAVFDDGSGPALYVGGAFDLAGGAPANSLARWDGTSWSDVGGGVTGGTNLGIVTCMTVLDDGSGPALYVGGGFDTAGGVSAHSIARWDGTSWSDVGSGASDPFFHSLLALQGFDDGTGPALYAGGAFHVGNGAVANNLARWNGQAWSAVGSGLTSDVQALEVHDDGSGPALYAGGEFTRSMAGQTLMRVARWDGASWSSLGSGLEGGFLTAAHALKSFRLDGIPRLFVGGQFTSAGGRRALDVACWSDGRRRRAR